ncbi:hypothetical protein DdX_16583 [Ditylenchus destructor]|uniref:Uncharacterized protein n=1 Tax=Ditylenchus destructor TaxID=166010 RepID=A0AAD4MMU8_9BILA|nr:hypothetical protein DdX_16583 [Ditylenchus destructor]
MPGSDSKPSGSQRDSSSSSSFPHDSGKGSSNSRNGEDDDEIEILSSTHNTRDSRRHSSAPMNRHSGSRSPQERFSAHLPRRMDYGNGRQNWEPAKIIYINGYMPVYKCDENYLNWATPNNAPFETKGFFKASNNNSKGGCSSRNDHKKSRRVSSSSSSSSSESSTSSSSTSSSESEKKDRKAKPSSSKKRKFGTKSKQSKSKSRESLDNCIGSKGSAGSGKRKKSKHRDSSKESSASKDSSVLTISSTSSPEKRKKPNKESKKDKHRNGSSDSRSSRSKKDKADSSRKHKYTVPFNVPEADSDGERVDWGKNWRIHEVFNGFFPDDSRIRGSARPQETKPGGYPDPKKFVKGGKFRRYGSKNGKNQAHAVTSLKPRQPYKSYLSDEYGYRNLPSSSSAYLPAPGHMQYYVSQALMHLPTYHLPGHGYSEMTV